MVWGASKTIDETIVWGVKFAGNTLGKFMGSEFGSVGRTIGGFLGKYLASKLVDVVTKVYDDINRNKLHFKCTKCNHKWIQHEEEGLIVRSRTRKSYKLKYLFSKDA